VGPRPIPPALMIPVALVLMLVVVLRGPSEASRRFSAEQRAITQTKPAAAPANDPTAGVEVTAQALPASKFCAFGGKAYVVYLPLDITVANGRRNPIILTRYLHVQRLLIGKNSAEVHAGKYELATTVRPFRSFGEGVSFGLQLSDDSWVVLKHNQTYEFTAVAGVPVRNDANEKVSGTVYPGDLALSFELQTWPFSRDASPLRRDWTRFGDLISVPVISYPTIIKLPANPVTEKCGLLAP
jgi:Na+-transporting methylmalonyl-CoA/oxaloacetate decarboxylase gamma subunit